MAAPRRSGKPAARAGRTHRRDRAAAAISRNYTLVPRWPLVVLEFLLLVVLTCAEPPAPHQFDASRQVRDLGVAGRHHLDNTLSAYRVGHPHPLRRGEQRGRHCYSAAARRSSSPTSSFSASGTGSWTAADPFARRAGEPALSRLPVPANGSRHRETREARLAADVRRLSLREPHQRDGLLADRHHAAVALGEGDDDGPGDGRAEHRRDS